ncbi:MAG: SPOR domain-containing protein [Rhizobium sp.]|nr:SPOR domain-containing protein [Rhizobium sp.]
MVQKQAAFSSRLGSDSFSDDDPLAELARIVGFEPPVARESVPTRPSAPEEPHFNLEDELLREFEVYDGPQGDGEELRAAERVVAPEARSPVEEIEELEDVFYPDAFVEPAAEAPSVHAESVFASEARPEPSFSVDLADELELAVSEPEEASGWTAPEPEPKLRLPLANFAAQPPVRNEPQFVAEEPVETAPQIEPERDAAPAAQVSPVDDFFSDEGFSWSETVSGPASALPGASTPRSEDPFGFDDLIADAGDRFDRPAEVAIAPAAAPAPRAEPSFSFSFADELAASEDTSPSTPAPVSVEAPAASVSFEQSVAPQAEAEAAPAGEQRPSIEDEEYDPFAEGEFDLQLDDLELDDLELDLSDIEADFDEPAPAPTVQPARPSPVSLATPVLAAAAPAMTPAPIAPAAQAPSMVSPRVAPAEVRGEPVTLPAAFDFADEPLAFDPAEISEQDDHLESIAHMDVPEVPVPDSKPAPVSYAHDYDLDIDGELATLFDQPTTTPAAATRAPATTPVAGVRQTPLAAAPATAPAPASVHAQAPAQTAQPASSSLPPMDDFDAFEQALEEDFRQTLNKPSDYAGASAGRINIPVEPKGLSRFGSRNLLMAGTAVVLVLLGGGALYSWLTGTGSSLTSSGEPQVIAADKDPVKILPENPGGKSVPNQDKAVYDSVAGGAVADPKQESLISSSEEPVDVVQKTLIPETLPLEDEIDAQALGTPVGETEDPRLLPDQNGAAEPAATAEPATITPRKVRTMIVRPDGTLVAHEAPEEVAPAPTLEAPAATDQPEAGKPALAAPSTAAEPALAEAPADAPTGPVPTARPSAPAETATAPQAPAPATPAAPVAETAAPAPVQAETPAAPTAEPAAPEPAAAQPAPAVGGYYIQVASLPSEAEAEKSYKSISSKFGSVVGGRAYEIKRAEIAGKGTYYRVRISAGSKADAAALCERYKAAGGSCLVTK